MKLSIVLSTQPTKFSALAYKGQLSENISQIKKLGYDGIELAVRDPNQLDVDNVISLLKENSLPVSAIGTGQAYGEEGLSFTNPKKEIRKEAISRIKSHIKLAEKFNAIIIIGLIRGNKDTELSSEIAENWLIDSLKECASANDEIKFAVEPINSREANLITNVDAGLNLLEKINKKNVGLLLDTYHMNIEEQSMVESIKKTKDKLFHFHVADSNRWYPGAGNIDFQAVLNTLNEIKYDGYISAEIVPMPDPDTAAKNTIEYLRGLLNKED
jgi:5-keto-L-gluconate epimerase